MGTNYNHLSLSERCDLRSMMTMGFSKTAKNSGSSGPGVQDRVNVSPTGPKSPKGRGALQAWPPGPAWGSNFCTCKLKFLTELKFQCGIKISEPVKIAGGIDRAITRPKASSGIAEEAPWDAATLTQCP